MVVIERDSVRVMVFDPDGRVLLLHTTDPADPERGSCWELPGGGVYPGESIGDAARRELYEETGIEIDDVGACVAVVEGAFSFGGATIGSASTSSGSASRSRFVDRRRSEVSSSGRRTSVTAGGIWSRCAPANRTSIHPTFPS
jgi:8-oxo-dGTP pyrophosphatase MutT (NUDIX family)